MKIHCKSFGKCLAISKIASHTHRTSKVNDFILCKVLLYTSRREGERERDWVYSVQTHLRQINKGSAIHINGKKDLESLKTANNKQYITMYCGILRWKMFTSAALLML